MFSVIIPVHNKLPHLHRTINSILTQSYRDFEIVVINDASTDGSLEKIKEYQNQKIRIYNRETPGSGGYAARNLGIKVAKYDWIAFLDADDEWHKDYLKEIKDCINLFNPSLVSTKWEKKYDNSLSNIDNNVDKLSYDPFNLKDYLQNPRYVWTGAVVIHKSIIDNVGGFPEDKLCKRGGDVDTWIRWLYESNKNIFINKTLSFYYQGTVNQVTSIPNTHFCAYKTLQNILKENQKNRKLRKAIKNFSNKFAYNMISRQVSNGMPLKIESLKMFYLDTYSLTRVIKLILLSFKKNNLRK